MEVSQKRAVHVEISMKLIKKYTIIGTIFVLLTGTLAHFSYEWSGDNYIVGLFTPVNESVWEHMKLVFFPMLLFGLFMIYRSKEDCPCITSSLCLGILAGTLLVPVLFYTYTGILGKDIFILDLGTFILSVLTAFLLIYKLTLSCKAKSHTFLLCALVCVLLVCFMVFTYYPPDMGIFTVPNTNQTPSQS